MCKIYEEFCGSCNRFIYYVDFHVGATNGHLPAPPVQIIRRKAIHPCHYCSTEKWRKLNKPCDSHICGILHGTSCRACGKTNIVLNEVGICAKATLRHHKHMTSNEQADTLKALRILRGEVVLERAVVRLRNIGYLGFTNTFRSPEDMEF